MNVHIKNSDPADPAYKIVGYAMTVLNEIGHGFREKGYERALTVEFDYRKMEWENQKAFPVYYRGVKIDEFIPDLIADNSIIVETKTVESINNEHIGQVLNYLKITGLNTGLILNFKNPKLEWRKVTLKKKD